MYSMHHAVRRGRDPYVCRMNYTSYLLWKFGIIVSLEYFGRTCVVLNALHKLLSISTLSINVDRHQQALGNGIGEKRELWQ
jgi:hypothetical protein